MKKYNYPEKEALLLQYKLKYKEEFLRLNNLKIGDEVEMEFPFERISRDKRHENKVTFKKLTKGVLKEYDDGTLYAESLEEMSFYRFVNHIRRDYYEATPKKSVIKFGTGFIL